MSDSGTKKLNLRRATLRLLTRDQMATIQGGENRSVRSGCLDCSNTCNTCEGNDSCPSGAM